MKLYRSYHNDLKLLDQSDQGLHFLLLHMHVFERQYYMYMVDPLSWVFKGIHDKVVRGQLFKALLAQRR